MVPVCVHHRELQFFSPPNWWGLGSRWSESCVYTFVCECVCACVCVCVCACVCVRVELVHSWKSHKYGSFVCDVIKKNGSRLCLGAQQAEGLYYPRNRRAPPALLTFSLE